MDNIQDFRKIMAKKKGEVLLEEVIENLYKAVQQGLIEDLIFVAVQKDKQVVHGLNTMDAFRAIGLLDTAKLLIQDSIYEHDDY